MEIPKSNPITSAVLLAVIVFALAAQAIFSSSLGERLTFEEMAESIRNPYWISQGQIYDGISSNVVYYKLLDLWYNERGFHLHAAREFRFFLSGLCFLFSSMAVLLFVRNKAAAVLTLLVVAVSPSFLFFGSSQASFGIDLQFFPVILFFWLFSLHVKGRMSGILLFLTTALIVLSGACFPPGLFLFPALILTDILYQWTRNGNIYWRQFLARYSWAFSGLFVGAMVPFLIVDDPWLLLNDPLADSGIFRGGGNITWKPTYFVIGLATTLKDLFVAGNSYEFKLAHPEFGTPLAWVGLASMFMIGYHILKKLILRPVDLFKKEFKETGFLVTFFALVLFLTYLVLAHISPNLPGLRRSAGMLLSFYLILFLLLNHVIQRRNHSSRSGIVFLILLLGLPVNHIVQLANNVQANKDPEFQGNPRWLNISASGADESLEKLYRNVIQGLPLTCNLVGNQCRYAAPFAALQYYHAELNPESGQIIVLAEDPVSGAVIPIGMDLWKDYYWKH